jgi:uncharacterized FlaG/YvyC family protein
MLVTKELLMNTNISNLRVTKHDSIEDAMDKNEKLIRMVARLQKRVKGLKTDNKTLKSVCDLNDAYLKEIVKDIPFEEILKCVNNKRPLTKWRKKCPSCQSEDINLVELLEFDIFLCRQCNYRNKIIKK